MAFVIPNEADATHSHQAEPHSRDIDVLVAGFGLSGTLTGGAVTAQGTPDQTVAVAAGSGLSDATPVAWAAVASLSATAADGTNPRIDLVYVTSGGTVTYTAGTAATNPTPPALPSGGIALAFIVRLANDNTIASTDITDKRVVLRDRAAPTYLVTVQGSTYFAFNPDGSVNTSGSAFLTVLGAVVGANRKIVLGPGTFTASGVWTDGLANSLVIEGQGMGVTTWFLANSSNSRIISNGNGNAKVNVTFRDLTFDGNMANQTNGTNRDDRSGIQLVSVDDLTFERVEIKGVRSGASIRQYACERVREIGCWFHDNGVVTTLTGSHALPLSTITVGDTSSFPSSGNISVGGSQQVAYTGKTATTFTGCTGGTGTFAGGTNVYPVSSTSVLLICDATFHGSCIDMKVIGNHYERNTDTGTALDGVVRAVVAGNVYRTNALGVGVGYSNTETGGTADSCEDIEIGPNIITGLNQANHECQGIKVGAFGNTGDGGNNRKISIHDNIISLCDRAIWADEMDDSMIVNNTFYSKAGPNGQLLLLAAGSTDVNRLRIVGNKFKDTTNRGISYDAGTMTGIEIYHNTFDSDVTTPIGGTEPSGTRRWGNKGVGETAPDLTSIPFTIDGSGATITTGIKGDYEVPFACTVTGWRLVADQTGSIVIDVWKDTYANFPPTVADTIAGSEKPTLSTATKNEDVALSTWTTSLAQGDWLRFNVDSVTTVTRVTLILLVRRVQ